MPRTIPAILLLLSPRAPAQGDGSYPGTGTQPVRSFRGMNILTPQPYGDAVFTSAYGGRAHLFQISNEGELRLIKANPEKLEVLGKVRVSDSATWAHLAVDGEQVLIREQDGLSAFRWRASP